MGDSRKLKMFNFFPPQTQRTPDWTPVRGPSPPRGTRGPPLFCMRITSRPPSPYPSPETSASSSRSRSLTWRPNTMTSVWITWRYVCVTQWPQCSHCSVKRNFHSLAQTESLMIEIENSVHLNRLLSILILQHNKPYFLVDF